MDAVITVKRQGASEPEPRLWVPSLNASVAGVRFFEGPKDLPPLKERIYSTVFSESRARFIDWELHLKYPKPGRTIDFVVHYRYYDNKGILLTKYDVNTHIEATWTSSYHAGGFKAKSWAPGTYRADFYIAGDKVASGTFEVVSE